jgi:hypothetical protein
MTRPSPCIQRKAVAKFHEDLGEVSTKAEAGSTGDDWKIKRKSHAKN